MEMMYSALKSLITNIAVSVFRESVVFLKRFPDATSS